MNVNVVNNVNQLRPAGNDLVGEEIAVGGTVKTISATVLGTYCTHVLVSVKSNDVLATFDGTAPASSGAGIYLAKNLAPMIWRKELAVAAKFIEATGSAAGVVRVEPLAE